MATQNQNKVEEFNKIFRPYDVSFTALSEFTKLSPKETGKTFKENALIKAKNAGEITKWKFPCLADDSGLSIRILSNKPGIHSARWVRGTDYPEVFKIIKNKIEEKGKSMNGQSAYFNCSLAFIDCSMNTNIFEGKLEGQLTFPARGINGFGYDPIFIPYGKKKTLAELGKKEKNKLSHRKIAINQLIEFLFEK